MAPRPKQRVVENAVSKQKQKHRVFENAAFLRLLHDASAKQRSQLIKTASKDQVLSVCECVFNVIKKNIIPSPSQTAKLRTKRKVAYMIADKSVPLSEKRIILEQNGGFIPALIAPLIGTVLAGAVEHFLGK